MKTFLIDARSTWCKKKKRKEKLSESLPRMESQIVFSCGLMGRGRDLEQLGPIMDKKKEKKSCCIILEHWFFSKRNMKSTAAELSERDRNCLFGYKSMKPQWIIIITIYFFKKGKKCCRLFDWQVIKRKCVGWLQFPLFSPNMLTGKRKNCDDCHLSRVSLDGDAISGGRLLSARLRHFNELNC